MTTKKQNAIDVAWNEAEELHSGLNEMTDDEILDCKNSGTSMRLLAGLLSYKKIPCTLIGDKSLSSRPM